MILVQQGQVWRSRFEGVLPADDPAAEAVMASGELFWVEDGRLDPRVADHPLVTGPPFLRFNATMPIRLREGPCPGVLSISGPEPHAFDAAKAGHLKDLADIIADEWARAEAAQARDRAFELSARSEQRLNLALTLADVHVWEMDYKSGQFVEAGAIDQHGGRHETFASLNEDIFKAIDPRDRAVVTAAWDDHIQHGAPYRPTYRLDRPDGAEVWVEGAIKAFSDARGRVVRLVGATRNITAHKHAEASYLAARREAEAANAAKTAFIATMSHEIRTPLNGVLGMAQAMAADALSPAQRGRLDVVRQSATALLEILNDILDISKIEAGAVVLEDIAFSLDETVAAALANFQAAAAEKGLRLVGDIGDCGGLYRGDPHRLRQILSNLIGNAVKFTEAGEIRLTAQAAAGGLRLTVEDSGIGIEQADLARLFTRFTQADSSTTRRFGGTGLGLAICRELAELMGGTITASSQRGRGSTFQLALPWERLAGPEADPGRGEAVRPQGEHDLERLRVLAAEDNPINREVLRALLSPLQIELVIVENGAEALARWEAEPWDVILMDVQMPVMDGPTATAEIRRRETVARRPRTPVIGLTANVMSHQLTAYLTAGMDAVVAKPIEMTRLLEALDQCLAAPDAPLAAAV